MRDYSIGVDMGGTNLRIAAITTEGQLLEKITLGVKVALGRDYVIGEMCDAIHRLTDQYRGTGRFVGAGIGVPGIIDVEKGMMRKSANLPGWTDYPVRDEIERRLGARIFLDNDARHGGRVRARDDRAQRSSLRLREPWMRGTVRLRDRCGADGPRGHRIRPGPRTRESCEF